MENFYTAKTEMEIREEQALLLALNRDKLLRFNLLFDVPRLYHCKSVTPSLNIGEYEDRYFSLFSNEGPTFLHIIDSISYLQNKDDWCPVGKGIIPYKGLIDKFNKCTDPIIIFEFESVDYLTQSRDFFIRNGIV